MDDSATDSLPVDFEKQEEMFELEKKKKEAKKMLERIVVKGKLKERDVGGV